MSEREHRRSRERIVRRHAPVLLEPQDLAAERAAILRARLLLAVARRDVELAIRSEGDAAAVVVRRTGDVVQQDRLARARAVRIAHANETIQRRTARCGIRVIDIDEAGPREVGIERDPEETTLRVGIRACGKGGPRLRLEPTARAEPHDAHPARSLGDEKAPVRRESDGPWRLEARSDELHVLDDRGTDARRWRRRWRRRRRWRDGSRALRVSCGRYRRGRGRRLRARDDRRECECQPAPHAPRCAQRRSASLAMGRASR